MQTETDKISEHQRALIFPALTPDISGKRVYFLFSVHQVEDIARDVSVLPVPFSQPFVKGIASWREYIVPVVSLEMCLGIETINPGKARRFVVVRTPSKEAAHGTHLLCMLNADPAMRMMNLPIECAPVEVNSVIPKSRLVKGIYEWKEGFLVVAHMEKILTAKYK